MAKRILFVGAERPSLHHEMPAFYLAKQGFEVLYLGTNDLLETEKLLGPQKQLRKIVIRTEVKNKIRFRVQQIAKIITLRDQCDLLYIYSPSNVYSGLVAQTGFQGPLVYHSQDFLDPNTYSLKARIERLLARRANLVVVNDPNRGLFLETFYNLRRRPLVVRTSLPVDTPFAKFSRQIREKWIARANLANVTSETLYLGLHIGSYSPLRCTETLLAALAKLPSHFCLVFTGTEPGSKEHQLLLTGVRKHNLTKRVGFLPRLDLPELMEVAAQADVGFLLYPDNDIGNIYQCPGRLTEYVGSGVPVVGSHYPSLDITIHRYCLGTVCDPFSPDSIADAILRLEKDYPVSRKELRQNVAKRLSYEIDAEKLLQEINSLL